MATKSSIILNTDDVPTRLQLQHAVSRLMKCSQLLKKLKGSGDTEDPRSLVETASFLDMLANRESRKLRKDPKEDNDPYISDVVSKFKTYLSTLPADKANELLEQLKIEEQSNDESVAHI